VGYTVIPRDIKIDGKTIIKNANGEIAVNLDNDTLIYDGTLEKIAVNKSIKIQAKNKKINYAFLTYTSSSGGYHKWYTDNRIYLSSTSSSYYHTLLSEPIADYDKFYFKFDNFSGDVYIGFIQDNPVIASYNNFDVLSMNDYVYFYLSETWYYDIKIAGTRYNASLPTNFQSGKIYSVITDRVNNLTKIVDEDTNTTIFTVAGTINRNYVHGALSVKYGETVVKYSFYKEDLL